MSLEGPLMSEEALRMPLEGLIILPKDMKCYWKDFKYHFVVNIM